MSAFELVLRVLGIWILVSLIFACLWALRGYVLKGDDHGS